MDRGWTRSPENLKVQIKFILNLRATPLLFCDLFRVQPETVPCLKMAEIAGTQAEPLIIGMTSCIAVMLHPLVLLKSGVPFTKYNS